jgi:CRISPR-associated endoribonuclease Cas6
MIHFSIKWIRVRIEYELKAKHNFDFIVPMIRGALGYSLYNTYCQNKLVRRCIDCHINKSCTYFQIFESPEYEGNQVKNLAIHPFQLSHYEYPEDDARKSREISFYLTVFGDPESLYPTFINEFKKITAKGLGKKSILAERMNVYDLEGNLLFHTGSKTSQSPAIYSIDNVNTMIQSIKKRPSKITFKLITPLQIKFSGKLLNRVDFSHIVRASARRVNMIEKYYGGDNRIRADQLLEQGGKVETVDSRLQWVSHSRYSTRKHQRMPLPGIVGELTISGDLSRFLPLLLLGEIFHVGAKTTFGLGQFIGYSSS